MVAIAPIHPDLLLAKQLVYDKCGFNCVEISIEPESQEYGATTFKLNAVTTQYRVAKITPTKIGQFVTLWKRSNNGIIQPFKATDDTQYYIISCRNGVNFGQFIFTKALLLSKGILSNDNQKGKLAIRVYPPWDTTVSSQAQKTQAWQAPYFLHVSNATNLIMAKKLLTY
jgi:hypothetical protein